jgi:hypothetical protein
MSNLANDATKVVTGLLATSVVALTGFVFDANTRLTVLESQAQTQLTISNENKENFRRLSEGIAQLNIVLTVLNDRLTREDKRLNPVDILDQEGSRQ